MFTHMVPHKKVTHTAHGSDYELLVYQVQETGEFQIYVTKCGDGLGDIFTASQEVVEDATGLDIVEALLAKAKDDINRNEFELY